jgi:hypothetical protein
MHYLSACAIYRDEAPYLREWIEFHRLVGVEHFFLYDDGSVDDHGRVLAPYVADGIVEVCEQSAFGEGQFKAYSHCLAAHGSSSRWIAFIDLDEFLFSPTGRPVADVLKEFESSPGVVVNWAVFGSSGHDEKPEGLVIESYLRRSANERLNSHVKSIVDPARVKEPGQNPHFFVYSEGCAVDENGRPMDEPPFSFSPSLSFERLRINHYYTRSKSEFRRKLVRPKAHDFKVQLPVAEESRLDAALESLNEVPDETILRYVPPLREALAERQPR